MLALLSLAVAALREPYEYKLVDDTKLKALGADADAAMAKADKATKEMLATPNSLLEVKGGPVKWTDADSKATEGLVANSYSNIDKVQDALIKAADQELAEQKKLPTLEQATHHWNARTFGEQGGQASSFAETGAPLEKEYAQAVDFSKLDQLRHKMDGASTAMRRDVTDLKAQTQKDEAIAKQVVEQGSLAQQAEDTHRAKAHATAHEYAAMLGKTLDEGHKRHIAAMLEKHEGGVKERKAEMHQKHLAQDQVKMQAAQAKLRKVGSALMHVEEKLVAKVKTGHAGKAMKLQLAKVTALLELLRKASGLVDGEHTQHPLDALAGMKRIKHSLAQLKLHHTASQGQQASPLDVELAAHMHELAEHADAHESLLQGKHADAHESLLQGKHADAHESLLQGKHADAHESLLQGKPDGGYAPIEKGLESLHDKIANQVADLTAEQQKAASAQVHTLSSSDKPKPYDFAWAQPSYAEVDAKGNMRSEAHGK